MLAITDVNPHNCRAAEADLKDVLVWSNDRVMRWVVGVGLKVFFPSFLHRMVVVLY